MSEHSVTGPKMRRGRGKAQSSLDLIDSAYTFLETAQPTTVRGVCYHLFVTGVIPSMARKETSRVSRLLTGAREDGTIPWAWIVDETRGMERNAGWSGLGDYAKAIRSSYRRDFWDKAQQRYRVEVWSEKGTIRGVLAPVLNAYGVGFRVMHGFSSATTVNEIAIDDDGRRLQVLYVGDWDPSGLYMSEVDLPERLQRYGGFHVDIHRTALMQKDVDDPELPSFPAADKRRDPRYRWFANHYGDQCWEVDAIHPAILRERVQQYIQAYIEPDAWARCEAAQQAEVETLQAFLDGCPAFKGVA